MNKALKHFTVMAVIVSESQPRQALLLHHDKSGLWMPPGGHIEAWENPLEATIREVKEEAGLDIAPYLPVAEAVNEATARLPLPLQIAEIAMPAAGQEPAHYDIDFMYLVRMPMQAVELSAESRDHGWFTMADIASLNTPRDIVQQLEVALA